MFFKVVFIKCAISNCSILDPNCSILDPHVASQAKSSHAARSIKNEIIAARFFIFTLVEQWHISIINMGLYDPIAQASSKLYCYISFEWKCHG